MFTFKHVQRTASRLANKKKIEKILKTFIDQKFFYRPNYSALGNLVRVTDPTVEDPFK